MSTNRSLISLTGNASGGCADVTGNASGGCADVQGATADTGVHPSFVWSCNVAMPLGGSTMQWRQKREDTRLAQILSPFLAQRSVSSLEYVLVF